MRHRRKVQLNLPLGDQPEEVWYRYSDPYEQGNDPYEEEFPVIRKTDKMVVLNCWGEEKYVLKEARRRFAYPTKELAVKSYIARKKRHLSILAAQHDAVKENLEAAEAFEERGMERASKKQRFNWLY